MSTRQQSLQELETLPDWMRGYEDPVVRTRGRSNKMHRPDPQADEPRPSCNVVGDSTEYDVKERAALQPVYEKCQRKDCFGGEQ